MLLGAPECAAQLQVGQQLYRTAGGKGHPTPDPQRGQSKDVLKVLVDNCQVLFSREPVGTNLPQLTCCRRSPCGRVSMPCC
jgi:hypothetical protein